MLLCTLPLKLPRTPSPNSDYIADTYVNQPNQPTYQRRLLQNLDFCCRYEKARAARCLPLTVSSYMTLIQLHISVPLLQAVRNFYVKWMLNVSHAIDHTAFDCGHL